MSEQQYEVVKVFGREVVLDKSLYRFNEATLNDFLQRTAEDYSTYNEILAGAISQQELVVLRRDAFFAEKFSFYRESKSTDKSADAAVRADPEYIKHEKNSIVAKRIVGKLKGFLKGWDLATNNAHELARNLRKEMDKLGLDIRYSHNNNTNAEWANQQLEGMFKKNV